MKGKRALACLKDSQLQPKSAAGKEKAQNSSSIQTKYLHVQAFTSHKSSDGEPSPRAASKSQFGTSNWAEVDYQFGGCSRGDSRGSISRDPSQPNLHHGVVQHQHEESMEVHFSVDGGECEGRLATFVRPSLEECEEPVVGITCKCADTNEGVEASVGKDTTNITNSSVV